MRGIECPIDAIVFKRTLTAFPRYLAVQGWIVASNVVALKGSF